MIEEAAAGQYNVATGAKSFIRCSDEVHKRLAVLHKQSQLGVRGAVRVSHGKIPELNPAFSPTVHVVRVGEIEVAALEPVCEASGVGCTFDL